VVAALRRPNAWIPRQLPQGSRDLRQSGPGTANRTCRFRLNGAYGTLRTRGVVGLAKANPHVRKRGARAEGHRQVEACKHRGPNRRDRRRRDPRSTQTHNPKRAAISRARRRTLKGARLRHVECGAFDGARPRGRRIADHWIATSTSIGMGNQDLSPEAATVALA